MNFSLNKLDDHPSDMCNIYFYPVGIAEGLYPYSQDQLLDTISEYFPNDQRKLQVLFKNSSIKQRHSIFPDLLTHNVHSHNFSTLKQLSTSERNNLYRQYAPNMFKTAATKCIRSIPNFDPNTITHLITASCTGCYSPGPADYLIASLGLNQQVERVNLGYMGCYAGLAATRVANYICRANQSAVVLVVTTEISSIHWQDSISEDNLLSLSLFSDGMGSGILSRKPLKKGLLVQNMGTRILPDSLSKMGWNMGERGFEMTLSREIPKVLTENLMGLITEFLEQNGVVLNNIDYWAVHPGGSRILELIADRFKLSEAQLASSWKILRDYGNMSSNTIFFVLEDILKNSPSNSKILSMAFGPGLSVELAYFKTTND